MSRSATEDKAQPTATTNVNTRTQEDKRTIHTNLCMDFELVKIIEDEYGQVKQKLKVTQ